MQYQIVPVTCFNQNCSIIWCEMTYEAALVDPGGDIDKLQSEIFRLKVKISKILLTHGHIDHVNAAMQLKRYYNVPIIGPNKADQSLLSHLDLQCSMLGVSFGKTNVVVPDIWLENGDIVKVGCEILHVLHCPGHSPGHVIFWNKIRKFILMGDVLFKGNIGRTDLPGGDITVLVDSIKNNLFPLGDDIEFLPGHGLKSTIGHERVHNKFIV